MKLCAISVILLTGAFLLTTTINHAAAAASENCNNCPEGEVACYKDETLGKPDPKNCCCGKRCVKTRAIKEKENVNLLVRECTKEDRIGCVSPPESGTTVCYCKEKFCNSASSLLPAGILVVMTTAVLCLIVWPKEKLMLNFVRD